MVDWLEHLLPNLRGTAYHLCSPPTDRYNCIAWSVGIGDAWWWPTSHPSRVITWPAGVARSEMIDAFREAFGTLGFVPCTSEEVESEFEKVALFADANLTPTHAARQLPTGNWTSKLGQADDIEHELRAIEGNLYATVVLFLKRPRRSVSTI